MRSTMYMHGQTRVPPWDEGTTSEVVGMVALGIGLGSPLVGFLSGGKVELGMVPVGAVGMIVATLIASCALDRLPALVVCITLIGFFTGFYIVPLFTLLQHRAPKTSKGDAIATSNFINVTGAIVSSVLFFLLVGAAHLTGITPTVEPCSAVEGELVEDPKYEEGKPVRIVLRTEDGEHVIAAKMPEWPFARDRCRDRADRCFWTRFASGRPRDGSPLSARRCYLPPYPPRRAGAKTVLR